MSWVRIDDQFTDHPKLAAAGPVAGWVYVSGLCYAARYLTDGFIPENIAARFAGSSPEILANLVECSLWDRVSGGYHVHDYLDYNPPASKVKAEREAAKVRMQRGKPSKQAVSTEIRENFARISPEIHIPPTPSPTSSSSGSETEKLSLADVLRLFTERFFETFGHQPPIQTTGDDGALANLIAAGLTLQQVDHAIAASLDSFTPTSANPYPKTWRYCLPAMQRAMEPPRVRPSKNGTDPTNRRSNVPGLSPAEQAAADARQAEYERQFAEELARAKLLK